MGTGVSPSSQDYAEHMRGLLDPTRELVKGQGLTLVHLSAQLKHSLLDTLGACFSSVQ
jgi:hypothetical protein